MRGLLHRARLVEDVADDGLNARLELAGEIAHRLALLVVGPLLRLLLLGMHPADRRRIVLEHGKRLGEPADLVARSVWGTSNALSPAASRSVSAVIFASGRVTLRPITKEAPSTRTNTARQM